VRFTVEYPIGSGGFSPAFLEPQSMLRFADALERAGIDALAFTEHPAPSKKWLDHGGHESFDPLTALAFCAAATRQLRLMPYLLVLPYRNPLLVAKQVATLDTLSAGRLILAVGTGYLRSEFAALGVDFSERNELMDEAVEVLRRVWTHESLAFEGRHFAAVGQVSVPPPQQLPHPPIWFGGNSQRARQRTATAGQGWAPLIIEESVARTTRTAAISSLAELRLGIEDLRQRTVAAGRDPSEIDVQVQWQRSASLEGESSATVDLLGELASAGVTWVVIRPPVDNIERAIESIHRYSEEVMPAARSIG